MRTRVGSARACPRAIISRMYPRIGFYGYMQDKLWNRLKLHPGHNRPQPPSSVRPQIQENSPIVGMDAQDIVGKEQDRDAGLGHGQGIALSERGGRSAAYRRRSMGCASNNEYYQNREPPSKAL